MLNTYALVRLWVSNCVSEKTIGVPQQSVWIKTRRYAFIIQLGEWIIIRWSKYAHATTIPLGINVLTLINSNTEQTSMCVSICQIQTQNKCQV